MSKLTKWSAFDLMAQARFYRSEAKTDMATVKRKREDADYLEKKAVEYRALADEMDLILTEQAGAAAQRLGASVTDLTFAIGGEALRFYTGMDGRLKIDRSRLVPAESLTPVPDATTAMPAVADDDDDDPGFDLDDVIEPTGEVLTDEQLAESAAYEALYDHAGPEAAEAWARLGKPLNGHPVGNGHARPTVAEAVTDDDFTPASELGAMQAAAAHQGFGCIDNEIG